MNAVCLEELYRSAICRLPSSYCSLAFSVAQKTLILSYFVPILYMLLELLKGTKKYFTKSCFYTYKF